MVAPWFPPHCVLLSTPCTLCCGRAARTWKGLSRTLMRLSWLLWLRSDCCGERFLSKVAKDYSTPLVDPL